MMNFVKYLSMVFEFNTAGISTFSMGLSNCNTPTTFLYSELSTEFHLFFEEA